MLVVSVLVILAVSQCEAQEGSGAKYSDPVQGCLWGYTDETDTGVTLEQCKVKCATASFDCKSLEYNEESKKCWLSSDSKETQPNSYQEPCSGSYSDVVYLETIEASEPPVPNGFLTYEMLKNVAQCPGPRSVKDASECARAAASLGVGKGEVEEDAMGAVPKGCAVNVNVYDGTIYFNKVARGRKHRLFAVICKREFPTVQCKGRQEPHNILLPGPGNTNRIEISSPNYPNSYSTSSQLSCSWNFQPQYSANVKITVEESNWENCNPTDNELKIHDDSNDGSLGFPGIKATCAPTGFPKTGKSVYSNDETTVEFKSGSANKGDISFKLIVQSTGATISPPKTSVNKCPNGPCCAGTDCCVYELGTNSINITSPGYPEISKKDLLCTYKLRTVEGSRIAFNFLELDMLHSESCNKDFVKLQDKGGANSPSLIGRTGQTFCGRQLPNSPGPSVLVSDDNELTVTYRTGKNVQAMRGRGFKASVAAVNPYLEPMTYIHTYGEDKCEPRCGRTHTPFVPPTKTHPPCKEIPLVITIMDNKTSTPISGAKVSATSVQTSPLSQSSSFVAITTTDGKINKDLPSNTKYQITVTKEGYEAQTQGLNTDCSNSDCNACAKIIKLIMVPVKNETKNETCPEGMTGGVQVIDELTKKPITGAVVNVVENGDTPVVTDVETDLEGKVTLPLTTNGNYSINVTKEGYDSVLLEEVEHNCTLSIVAELPQPVCKEENVTITLNVHVKDKETDDGIENASVNVYANGNAIAVNEDPLIADKDGKVTLAVSNSGSYKVEVQATGMHSKQEDVDVICDKTKCKNCTTLAVLELEKMEEEPVCNETKLAVQTINVATEVGVDAVVTVTFTPENNGRPVIVADKSEVGANGNLTIPIEGNGKYVVLASAGGYMDNTKTLVVNCSTDDCSSCKPNIKIPLEKEVCTEIEFKIKVTDELTNNPIPSAKVVAKKITENGTEVVISKGRDYMVTDEDGRVEVPIEDEAKYTVEITKEGYEPYDGNKTIECGDMKANHICPCEHALSVGMNQVFCNKTITMDITILNENDTAVPNANVVIKLTSSVAGASSTNVGGKLTTDANGVVSSPIFTSGTYQITVEADDYMDKTIKMDIENSTACDHIRIPLNVTIIEQPEEYCQNVPMTVTIMDKNTKTPIPSAAVDITLGKRNFVTPFIQVADGTLTDASGKIEVTVSLGGNYDVSVSKAGYLPLNGTAVVKCDINDCKSCSVTIELDMDQPRCPDVVLPVTITDEDTGEPIKNAKVKLVLIDSLSGPSILDVGSPKLTNETGTTTFEVDMNGNYSIRIEADGYDTKNLPINIDCNPEHCKGCVPMAKTTMKKKFCQDKTFEFIVRNSVTNEPATGAVVKVTKQVEEYGPTEVASLTVPSTGRVDVPIDGNGNYVAEISLADYETFRTDFVVDITLEQCELLKPVELQPMSPSLPCDDGIRISLSWGANPKDLDLYSNQVNKNTSKDECLTYYCDGKESCPGSNFDVDNKAGGYSGSETITFCDNDDYVQMVYVDDLSGKGASLLKSGAKLVIISKTTTKVIHLDPSDANAPARYWLAGCLTMKKGTFDWIEVNQFMDRKPHTEEPLHCYNRNLMKESDQNKDSKEYKIVTRAYDYFGVNNLVRISSKLAAITKRVEDEAVFTVAQGLYTVDITSDGYIPVKRDAIVHTLTAKNNYVDVDFNMLPQHAPTSVDLLLEWPESKQRGINQDLDLYALKVNRANSLETCKTNSNKRTGCKDVTQDKNDRQGGLNGGGETITVNNTDASSASTFLIYARDSTITMGSSIETSGGQLTIANGKKILVESLPKTSMNGAKWWIIGCMQTNSDGFDFVPLGTYSRKNPYDTKDKLKCHDVFKTYTPPPAEPFCKDATLKVGVYDSVTNAVVPNATVSIKVDGSTFSQIVPTVGDANPINMNGEYIVSANAPGYVSKIESTTVKCDPSECGKCNPSVLLYLSPALSSPQFRLTLSWDQGDHDLDMFVVQRNPSDLSYSCTTSVDSNANSGCKTLTGKSCVFPFIYKEVSYNSCTDVDSATGAWCATSVDKNGVVIKNFWDDCSEGCPGTDNCNGVSINSGGNAETVTFTNSEQMVYMVYIRDKPCEGPQDFVRANPKISITDGKLTSELETNKALYNNNKYWLAACINQLGNAVQPYKFSPVNIFLNAQPDIEVPDQCLYQLGHDVPAPTVKKWNILKKSAWLG